MLLLHLPSVILSVLVAAWSNIPASFAQARKPPTGKRMIFWSSDPGPSNDMLRPASRRVNSVSAISMPCMTAAAAYNDRPGPEALSAKATASSDDSTQAPPTSSTPAGSHATTSDLVFSGVGHQDMFSA